MDKQETIADITAAMWVLSNSTSDGITAINGRVIADRLDAAWKREKAAIETATLAVGGMVEAARTTAEKSSVVGDIAKLREALSDACYAMFNFLKTQNGGYEEMANALDKAKAALAAPPRNCDMPLVVNGPADNNADKAWLVFKRRNPDVYFDCSGLLRCIDWLFAPATAKEGGANE